MEHISKPLKRLMEKLKRKKIIRMDPLSRKCYNTTCEDYNPKHKNNCRWESVSVLGCIASITEK